MNPLLCINPLTRRQEEIPASLRGKMQNWLRGCDICQEVCPVNRELTPREPDSRAGFDPEHHRSHWLLDGLDRTPSLVELLSPAFPDMIRRNAVIALANIGEGWEEALRALREHAAGADEGLRAYFEWAIRKLE